MNKPSEPMRKVLIDCPLTGKAIFTGVKLPEDLLQSKDVRIGPHQAHCFHCGKVHRWEREDAYLAPNGDK